MLVMALVALLFVLGHGLYVFISEFRKNYRLHGRFVKTQTCLPHQNNVIYLKDQSNV